MWRDKWLPKISNHISSQMNAEIVWGSHKSVTQSLFPFGRKERRSAGEGAKRRVEKTTQSDKVTLTQLSARSSRCERRGRGTREGGRGVAIDRNRIHTAPSIYWRIIIATASEGAREGNRGSRGCQRGPGRTPRRRVATR